MVQGKLTETEQKQNFNNSHSKPKTKFHFEIDNVLPINVVNYCNSVKSLVLTINNTLT